MKMISFLILFFNFFSFSFQAVDVVFIVNCNLLEINVIENGVRNRISGAVTSSSFCVYPVYNLNANPGDLIEIKADNTDGAGVLGGGCFLMNNKCYCSLFKNDYYDYTLSCGDLYFDYQFPSITCGLTIKCLSDYDVYTNYYYKEYIPLLASTITCKGGSLIYLNGEKYNLRLLDFISVNFNTKNLQVSITENYAYFTLNNNQLNSGNKFHISSVLTFSSTVSKKYNINFRNIGIRDSDKICSMNIRVCHIRCAKCYDKDIDEEKNELHQCEICKSGFYPVEDNNNCMTEDEMIGSNYYFDKDEQKFKRCYKSCATCNAKSLNYEHNCTECANKYHYIYNEIRKKKLVFMKMKNLQILI